MSQIPRSSILRSLDVLHGQLVVDDQRVDAFNVADSPRGARREASPQVHGAQPPLSAGATTGNTGQSGQGGSSLRWSKCSAQVRGGEDSKEYLRALLTDTGRGESKCKTWLSVLQQQQQEWLP